MWTYICWTSIFCLNDVQLIRFVADIESVPSDPEYISVNFDTIGHDKYLQNKQAEFGLFADLDQWNAPPCIYLLPENIHSISNDTSLSMVHLNVCSVIAHLDELKITALALKSPPIIGLCETWLRSYNENLYSIVGYVIISNSHCNRGGGGVAFLISEILPFSSQSCSLHFLQTSSPSLSKLK